MIDNGSGDSHTLLLSAGKLCRFKMKTVAKTDSFQGLSSPFNAFLLGDTGINQRQIDIFQSCLFREQMETLEHKADIV